MTFFAASLVLFFFFAQDFINSSDIGHYILSLFYFFMFFINDNYSGETLLPSRFLKISEQIRKI